MSCKMKTIHSSSLALYVFVLPFAQAHNMNESHKVSIDEARMAMSMAANTDNPHFTELRDALARIYSIVPKNEHGLLAHGTVRYVLHRFFQQRNGWFIKGLAPNETQSWHRQSSATIEDPKIKDWVPSFLQDDLEYGFMQRSGTNLTGLVQLAAALEELVQDETRDRINMAYEMHMFRPIGRHLNFNDGHALIRTFFITFLVAGVFKWDSIDEVDLKESIFAAKYPGYEDLMDWMTELVQEHHSKMADQFGTAESLVQLALTIQKRYHLKNDAECRGMKHNLMEMEGKKAGRVRLSTFYNKSLYSTFKFNEKAEYLKALGVLDDSDPRNPQVVIANYVMARTNCLEGSSIYAVCCRNECEDLLGNLESQLQSSLAEPKKIVDIVSTLTTDTMNAPRAVGADLLARLEQVAAQNHGQVPIHGRLFNQWMHHAFARECPYPHQTGSAIPLTPEEWMASSKQSDAQASTEEMQETVQSAVCAIDDQGKPKGICEEDESLPWSDEEELLGVQLTSQNKLQNTPSTSGLQFFERFAAPLSVAMSLMALGVLYWDFHVAAKYSMPGKQDVLYVNCVGPLDLKHKLSSLKKAVGLWVLAMIVWVLDLPDASVVGWTICSYMMFLAGRVAIKKHSGWKKVML